jgi:putative transposase
VTAPWTHRAMVGAPFADFTWRHAPQLAAQASGNRSREVTETAIARALEQLLTRAEHGPDRAGARVVARTRTAAASHLPTPPALEPTADPETGPETSTQAGADVIPFGVFDADAEAERWL